MAMVECVAGALENEGKALGVGATEIESLQE